MMTIHIRWIRLFTRKIGRNRHILLVQWAWHHANESGMIREYSYRYAIRNITTSWSDATAQITRLNNVVRYAHTYRAHIKLTLLDRSSARIVGHSDAAFFNSHDNTSQLCRILMLIDDTNSKSSKSVYFTRFCVTYEMQRRSTVWDKIFIMFPMSIIYSCKNFGCLLDIIIVITIIRILDSSYSLIIAAWFCLHN